MERRIQKILLILKIYYKDGSYVIAGRKNELIDSINSEIKKFGLYPTINTNIIPDNNDKSTLFNCSGMQPLKYKFELPNNTQISTYQSCIRTNDIDLVGDGTHLTSFTMIGTFGFGTNNYEEHCVLWSKIVDKLKLPVTHVTFHPNSNHENIWKLLGYKTIPSYDCVWSQGAEYKESFCSELFIDDLEIGNLVNPDDISVDVGFGLERLLMIYENVNKVDETSAFDQSLTNIGRDYKRTLELFYNNSIHPGNKGRNYICRKLLRTFIRLENNFDKFIFKPYIDSEIIQLEKVKENYRRYKNKFKNQNGKFWWETFGILPEELEIFKLAE
jgi:alanyl-tRNA synthetase